MTYNQFNDMFLEYMKMRLNDALQEAGTQQILCENTGLTAPTMSRIMNLDYIPRDETTWNKITKILGEDLRMCQVDLNYVKRARIERLQAEIAKLQEEIGNGEKPFDNRKSGRYPWDKIEKEGFCSVCAIEKGSPTCEKCRHKEEKR